MDALSVGGFKILRSSFFKNLKTGACFINFKDLSESITGEGNNMSCRIALNPNLYSLKVTLRKNSPEPAIATVKFKLDNMQAVVRNVDNWTQEFEIEQVRIYAEYNNCFNKHHEDTNVNNFLIGGKCEIIWYGFIDQFYSPYSQNLYTSYMRPGEPADLQIVVGDLYYPVHQQILAPQCSIFEKMTLVKMERFGEDYFDFTEFGNDVVDEILLILYENRVGKAQNNEELLLELLKVSEMLEIGILKNCCGYLLSKMISADNVLMMLENGYVYKSPILKTRAIAYVLEKEDDVLYKSECKELLVRWPELCFEVCSMMKFLYGST